MANRSIVIIGGGIIGTSTAYYLSLHPNLGNTKVTLVEGSYIAAGSSGKGAGFLAKSWHGPSTASLGRLSFTLHEQLAEEFDGEKNWGFRKVSTLSIDTSAISKRKGRPVPEAPWITDVTGSAESLGDSSTTAQVQPFQMTNVLISAAKEKGVNLIFASADGVQFNNDDEVSAVTATSLSGEKITIPATDVLFAAGPWTGKLAKALLGHKAGAAATIAPSPKSTSIVIKPPLETTPHILFCTVTLPDGSHAQPEFYPRPDGTIYICGAGMGDQAPLPDRAADVEYSQEGVDRLKERISCVVREEWYKEPLEADDFVKQACYRPDSKETGLPIIGKLSEGLWVASGHQVWGISLGPGTGKIMAELMIDGKAISADIPYLFP